MGKSPKISILLTILLSPATILAQDLGDDPGPSIQYVYRQNASSGSHQLRPSIGPFIIDAEAMASGNLFGLVNAALALGTPDAIVVLPAFDPSEFPGSALEIIVVTKPITIDTGISFFLQPRLVVPTTLLPEGVSQPDFRNLFFQDYTVSINEIDVNQEAAIPYLFGPLQVTGTQLGNPNDPTSYSVTGYNITFRIESLGQHLVGVQWKTYQTLEKPGDEDDVMPAGIIKIAIPVTVGGDRSIPPYQREVLQRHRGGLLQAQTRLHQIIARAIKSYKFRR